MSNNRISPEKREEIIRRYNATMFVVLLLSALKTFGIVEWDWIWVFSPLWVPVATAVAILALAILFGVFRGILALLFRK